VAIADLDLILEPRTLFRVVEKLSTTTRARQLEALCSTLATEIAKLVPTLSETDVTSRLEALAAKQLDWSNRDDEPLAHDLRDLARSIDRKRRVKTGGIESFKGVPTLQAGVESLVSQCGEIGLFLVPVGELECWAPDLMKGVVGRDQKPQWANEFVKRLAERPNDANDVVKFTAAVDAFHAAEAERLATGVEGQ